MGMHRQASPGPRYREVGLGLKGVKRDMSASMTVVFKDLCFHVMVRDPDAKQQKGAPKMQKTIIHGISGSMHLYAKNMPDICKKYARNMPEICKNMQ